MGVASEEFWSWSSFDMSAMTSEDAVKMSARRRLQLSEPNNVQLSLVQNVISDERRGNLPVFCLSKCAVTDVLNWHRFFINQLFALLRSMYSVAA